MWAVGTVLLLLVSCGLCLLIAGRRDEAPADIWDVAGTARTYTTIVGTLAGFSVTSAIFIANLTTARESDAFEGVMALFLIAFLVFISAGMQFGTTPNLPDRPAGAYQTIQGYSYLLANASYYLGLALSWLGLPLLLSAVGLRFLADIVLWLVLFAILGGAMRICGAGLSVFTGVQLPVGLAVPAISFVGACFYRLVLARQFPDLLPAEHGATLFAVLCFVLGSVGFVLQSTMVASLQNESSAARVVRVGGPVLLAFISGMVTSSSLLWLAVAAAI